MKETTDAGPFGAWLAATIAALRGVGGTNVPCGDCVGCCVSSYFIPIRPEDSAARKSIPIRWLVRAPSQPPGQELMGYRDDGTCPMFAAHRCTIYSQRPQTCRDYDCRIFAAAGIDAGGPDKTVINRRVRAWRFNYESADDERRALAIKAAASFIRDKRASFRGHGPPTAPTGIAVLAIKAHEVFLRDRSRCDEEIAAAIVVASREFDAV